MQKQKLLYENLVASVNDFTQQLGQVAELTEGFDGGAKRPYFAFALHMLLSSEASVRLGAGWYLMVIQCIVNELNKEFSDINEFEDFVDEFFDLFNQHNIVLPDDVIDNLEAAFDLYADSLDLPDHSSGEDFYD
jgi:hypothetical protein